MTSPPPSNRSRWFGPRRHWHRAGIAVAAALAMVGVTWGSPVLAGATPVLAVTGTSVSGVVAGTTTTLSGIVLSGDDVDSLQVTVATDLGNLSMTETANLTLATGYSWSGPAISFSGTEADDNAGLASLALVAGADAGTANVTVNAFMAASGLSFSSSNQHFYQYIDDSGLSWSEAEAAAATQTYGGLNGYLASIPDATVNTLLADSTGVNNIWFGAHVDATDTATYALVWKWTDGPLAGGIISQCTNLNGTCDFVGGTDGLGSDLWSSWSPGEPNNYGGVEDAAVTNSVGLWNDLPDANGTNGYLVEYGDHAVGSSVAPTGTASSTSSVDVFVAPSAPTGATATTTGTSATITWTASGGGSPATSYTVTTSPGGSTCTPDPATATSCTVTGLIKGTSYTFKVTATNAAGTSDPSDLSNSVIPLTAPGVPTGLAAAPGNGEVILTFSPPGDDGGTAITGFDVTRDGGVTWQPLTTTGTGPIIATLTGLTNGDNYGFAVRADNAFADSAGSTTSRATPGPSPMPRLR